MPAPLPQLKLQLIQAVLRTDDPQVLRTALQVLSLGKTGESTGQSAMPMAPANPSDMLNQGAVPTNPEVQALQRDIDDLFNVGAGGE